MISRALKTSEYKNLLLKAIIFFGISLLYIGRAFNDVKDPYFEGDGLEYVLMTESFYNHMSPDLRLGDVLSLKQNLQKYYYWKELPKNDIIDDLIQKLTVSKHHFKKDINGFFFSKRNVFYSYHYFSYSFFCLPAKVLCKMLDKPESKAFAVTNAVLIVLSCFLLLFFSFKNNLVQIFSTLCFAFGSNYWYLGWEHTEIFTVCALVCGFLLFLNKKTLVGLFFLSLAVSQTQTLILFYMFLAFWALIENKFNLRFIIKLFFISLLAISPMLFYYYHFETINLIKEQGFLDSKFITINRVVGFYFDINQGMILAMPLVLLSYIFLLFKIVMKVPLKEKIFNVSIPLLCILMTITVSSMGNWNPGQAIVNRYTTWIGAIIFVHVFTLILEVRQTVQFILLTSFFWTQLVVCFYFQNINIFDWESAKHKMIAKWVLNNYPSMYNPDPMIFSVRTMGQYNIENDVSPIIYFDNNHEIMKVMFNQKNKSILLEYTLKKNDFTVLNSYKDNFGWSFLKDEDLKLLKPGNEIYTMIRIEKVNSAKNKLKSNPIWIEIERKKAIEWKKTLDEVIDLDAEYLIQQEEKESFVK